MVVQTFFRLLRARVRGSRPPTLPGRGTVAAVTAPLQPRRVLILGDSLTVACEDQLRAAADLAGVDLVIRAEIGRSVRAALPILCSTADQTADQILDSLKTYQRTSGAGH